MGDSTTNSQFYYTSLPLSTGLYSLNYCSTSASINVNTLIYSNLYKRYYTIQSDSIKTPVIEYATTFAANGASWSSTACSVATTSTFKKFFSYWVKQNIYSATYFKVLDNKM